MDALWQAALLAETMRWAQWMILPAPALAHWKARVVWVAFPNGKLIPLAVIDLVDTRVNTKVVGSWKAMPIFFYDKPGWIHHAWTGERYQAGWETTRAAGITNAIYEQQDAWGTEAPLGIFVATGLGLRRTDWTYILPIKPNEEED